jgi:hypothetical protein
MLVILKEPIKAEDFDILACNIEAFDSIITYKSNNQFHLAIHKHFDGHFSNQSSVNCPINACESYQECLDFFQKIVDAINSGQQVFDLRSETDRSSNLKDLTGPTV